MKALDELEKIAGEMPEIAFYYHYILGFIPVGKSSSAPSIDEEQLGLGEKYEEKSKRSVSKSGYSLGDHDFFFEWAKEPDGEQLRNLIEKVENALTPLGCRYTITTK
ncbi:MAG: hypothetical protein ABSB89_03415 [Candidatus Bathyarchaeia archaeon]